jgi:hypothetical protein
MSDDKRMNISDEAVEAATTRLVEAMSKERGLESPYVDAEDPNDAVIEGVFNLPAIVREVLEAAAPHLVAQATALIRDLTDPEECSFDHHGGCQAHGYLNLEPGESCPQADAKSWAGYRMAEDLGVGN